MELGWGGFDRAKLDMLMLIRIPFSFHVPVCTVLADFLSVVRVRVPISGSLV